MLTNQPAMRFQHGRVVMTRGAEAEIPRREMLAALSRHLHGDWGNVCEEDRRINDAALKNGDRLLSSYQAETGTKFWIITEADRSATTVLLPEEY